VAVVYGRGRGGVGVDLVYGLEMEFWCEHVVPYGWVFMVLYCTGRDGIKWKFDR